MMKVEENLVVLPTSHPVKRRQAHYLPKKPDLKQSKIDDFLLKKKKRLNENDLISTCPKKAKMMLNPFNKFNSYYLFNSSDHCSSTKLHHHTAKINNSSNHQSNLQNIQNNIQLNKTNTNSTNHALSNQTKIQTINLNNQLNQVNHKITNHLETNVNHLLFNKKTGLPFNSSPIPQHKNTFSFERSIKSSNAIKRAILNKEPETDENFNLVVKKPVKAPLFRNLLGNFEVGFLIHSSFFDTYKFCSS